MDKFIFKIHSRCVTLFYQIIYLLSFSLVIHFYDKTRSKWSAILLRVSIHERYHTVPILTSICLLTQCLSGFLTPHHILPVTSLTTRTSEFLRGLLLSMNSFYVVGTYRCSSSASSHMDALVQQVISGLEFNDVFII